MGELSLPGAGNCPRGRLTRREWMLAGGALAASAVLGTRDTRAERPRTLPIISGALRQYNPVFHTEQGMEGWKRELDEEQAIGFDLLWLAHTSPALENTGTPNPLLELLDLCAAREISVILDTGGTGRWFVDQDLDAELGVTGKHIQTIGECCGTHPAFFGWYIPHEIYVAWDAFGTYVEGLYGGLVERCKASTPGKPVTLSPFFILDQDKVFGDFRYAPPHEYGEYWAALIKRTGIDIVMLQDSGEHFSYVTDAQRRPFFEAMHAAVGSAGATLWGNVETAEFDCPSIEEYVRRYGRVHHGTVKDAPWRAVPMDRLQGKLELAAEFCTRMVTWGYVEKCRPHLGPEAAEWYAAYRDYHSGITKPQGT